MEDKIVSIVLALTSLATSRQMMSMGSDPQSKASMILFPGPVIHQLDGSSVVQKVNMPQLSAD